jgi:hypothetical protein
MFKTANAPFAPLLTTRRQSHALTPRTASRPPACPAHSSPAPHVKVWALLGLAIIHCCLFIKDQPIRCRPATACDTIAGAVTVTCTNSSDEKATACVEGYYLTGDNCTGVPSSRAITGWPFWGHSRRYNLVTPQHATLSRMRRALHARTARMSGRQHATRATTKMGPVALVCEVLGLPLADLSL